MAKYHKYVFDVEKRTFIGDFENMYAHESIEKFDSWHQDDSRQLQRKICLEILNQYNFNTIVDIGCGKGALTHILKKKNNNCLGIDISQTAIDIAKERFNDIDFVVCDINNIGAFSDLILTRGICKGGGKLDLVFSSEAFSYFSNYKKLLKEISEVSDYFMISLYLPNGPIGFVKSESELLDDIRCYFEIVEHVSLSVQKSVIVFAKSKQYF